MISENSIIAVYLSYVIIESLKAFADYNKI